MLNSFSWQGGRNEKYNQPKRLSKLQKKGEVMVTSARGTNAIGLQPKTNPSYC